MLNNFCFHLYAQKSLFIAENCNVFWDISSTLPCEFRGHRAGSQLKMSESQTKAGNQEKFKKIKNLKIWNFKKIENWNLNGLSWSSGHAEQHMFSCLGSKVAVYSWKLQWFFWDLLVLVTLSCDFRVHRAGSQLKMSESQTGAGNLKTLKNWKPANFKTFKTLKVIHHPLGPDIRVWRDMCSTEVLRKERTYEHLSLWAV